MKKITMIAVLLFGTAFAVNAQSDKNKPERIKLVPSGHTTTMVKMSKAEQIKKCEDQIAAIDTKEVFILSDAKEREIAEETNWFENANKTRAELRAKIIELKK